MSMMILFNFNGYYELGWLAATNTHQIMHADKSASKLTRCMHYYWRCMHLEIEACKQLVFPDASKHKQDQARKNAQPRKFWLN